MANEWDFSQQGAEFDAQTVEPQGTFEALPAGEYEAVIIDTEQRDTKTGGKYLWLKLEVLAGQHKGRHLHDNLNLVNASTKAVEIARATLSSICRAVGVMTPKSSAELRNKPLIVKLGVERSEQYGEQNKIKAYKPIGEGKPIQLQPIPKVGTPEFDAEAERMARGGGDIPF